MTEKILTKAIELANKEFKKCSSYLEDNSIAWNVAYDLKMRDANLMDSDDFTFEFEGATISFNDECINRAFYDWCEIEYDAFIDWCDCEGIIFDKIIDRIGRTSKFYLGYLHDCSFYEILDDVSYCYYNSLIVLKNDTIDYDETIKAYDGDLNALCEDLLNLTSNVYNELTYIVDDYIKVAKYIRDFKNNQCINFKEFVIESWKSLVFDSCLIK